MSDVPIDATWWLASDGKWYPPALHPKAQQPPTGPSVTGIAGSGPAEIVERGNKGVAGEQATAKELMKLPSTYHIIHGLKKGSTRGDIDHLVIGPTGVWVIDSKNDAGHLTANKGTLWNGRYSIDPKVQSVESQAKYASNVLGVDANPVLCFVQAALPRPAQMVGRTRVVELDALAAHIMSGQTIMLPSHITMAVDRVGQWRRKPPPARSAPPPRPPNGGPHYVPSAGPPPSGRSGGSRIFTRLVIAALATIGALTVFGIAIVFAVGGATKGAREFSKSMSGAATTTTLVGPGWINVSIDCPAPNGGHRLKPHVNGGTPGHVRVSATVNGEAHYLGEFVGYQSLPPIMGIAPNTTVGFDIQLVDEVGQTVPGYHIDITAPPTPC